MAPAIPTLSTASASTVPLTGAAYNHHMFGHALAVVRSKGAISIAEFQKAMHFTAPQAEVIIGDLARKGMISNSFSASGILNAVKPNWFPNAPSTSPTKIIQAIDNQSKNISKTVKNLTEATENEAAIEEEEYDA